MAVFEIQLCGIMYRINWIGYQIDLSMMMQYETGLGMQPSSNVGDSKSETR